MISGEMKEAGGFLWYYIVCMREREREREREKNCTCMYNVILYKFIVPLLPWRQLSNIHTYTCLDEHIT